MIKYPKQVDSIKRQKITFGIDEYLTLPKEEDSPLEMHSGYSRYKLSLIDKTNDNKLITLTANIPAKEIPYIYEKTKIAMAKILETQLTNVNTSEENIAYTQKIASGIYKGKTPAEVLLTEPDKIVENIKGLLKQREWLNENISKYKGNSTQIEAIEQAIMLYKEKKLNEINIVSGKTFNIYKAELKIPDINKKDKNGMTFVYALSIVCDPTKNYPFIINFMNCYAPPLYNNGNKSQVEMSKAINIQKCSLPMTELEWSRVISRMNTTLENFERIYFPSQYKKAYENSYHYQ